MTSENDELKGTLDSSEKKISSLQSEVKSLLSCDYCDNIFDDKNQLKNHIKSLHEYCMYERTVKCKFCNVTFNSEKDMASHVIVTHKPAIEKERLLKKQNELVSNINLQKMKIYEKILMLKQKELQEKEKCSCKGICNIDHKIYRWVKPMSNTLVDRINKTEQTIETVISNEPNYSSTEFPCQQCEHTFTEETNYQNPMETIHKQQCDQAHTTEVNLINHINYEHNANS